jgi:hypothetical protein
MALRPRLATLAPFVAALGAAAAWRAEREGPPDPASEPAGLVPGHRPLLGRGSLASPHAPFDPAAPPVGPDEREGRASAWPMPPQPPAVGPLPHSCLFPEPRRRTRATFPQLEPASCRVPWGRLRCCRSHPA